MCLVTVPYGCICRAPLYTKGIHTPKWHVLLQVLLRQMQCFLISQSRLFYYFNNSGSCLNFFSSSNRAQGSATPSQPWSINYHGRRSFVDDSLPSVQFWFSCSRASAFRCLIRVFFRRSPQLKIKEMRAGTCRITPPPPPRGYTLKSSLAWYMLDYREETLTVQLMLHSYRIRSMSTSSLANPSLTNKPGGKLQLCSDHKNSNTTNNSNHRNKNCKSNHKSNTNSNNSNNKRLIEIKIAIIVLLIELQ